MKFGDIAAGKDSAHRNGGASLYVRPKMWAQVQITAHDALFALLVNKSGRACRLRRARRFPRQTMIQRKSVRARSGGATSQLYQHVRGWMAVNRNDLSPVAATKQSDSVRALLCETDAIYGNTFTVQFLLDEAAKTHWTRPA